MHILIIETALNGHHSGYLERISAAFMDEGHEVTVTVLQRDAKHDALIRLSSKYFCLFNVTLIEDAKYLAAFHTSMGESGRELALRSLFGKVYRAIRRVKPVDYVFLPYLDYCLYAIGLLGSPFGSTQWGGICMRPSFHYTNYKVIAPIPKLAKVKLYLFKRLLQNKYLKSIFTIDELLHHFITEHHPHLVKKIQYVSDPAELIGNYNYNSARRELGICQEAIIVLVYGSIDDRKGIDVLVDALCSPNVNKNFHLLVVGKQSESIKTMMNSDRLIELISNKRCYIINTFANNELEQMVFAASDVIWLGYKNHFTMSGVLVLARIAEKPVIATQNGLIGWYTKKYRLGISIDANCVSAVINALQLIKSYNFESKKQSINNTWHNFLMKLVR